MKSLSLQQEAEHFLQNGRYKEAEVLWTTLSLLFPSDSSTWLGLGLARFYQNDISKAEQAFDIAWQLNKESLTSQLWTIECHIKNEQRDKAKKLLANIYKNREDSLEEYERNHLRQLKTILVEE